MAIDNVEKQVVEALVDTVLATERAITVNDGTSNVLERSTDKTAILAAMGSTGEDTLVVHEGHDNSVGAVTFTYGRGGRGVLASHTDNAEMVALVKPAKDLAQTL